MREAGRGGPEPTGTGSGGPKPDGVFGRSRRMLWFVAFYALSLVAFTALVYALRFIVRG